MIFSQYCCGSFSVAQPSLLSLNTPTTVSDSLNNLPLKGVDGPYVFRDHKSYKVLRVVHKAGKYLMVEERINKPSSSSLTCAVDNEDRDVFSFSLLKKMKSPNSTYRQPDKLLAISDIEGNFNAFFGLLVANGVMDKDYNWTFGKGHLVLVGDFMDRGMNVTPVLWLIYKLEQEAKNSGGFVHFILGNHEILNIEGNTTYVDEKYLHLAQKFTKSVDPQIAYQSLMSPNQELIRWMKTKNSVEKIGNFLFVHGGISPELVQAGFTVGRINTILRRRLNFGSSNDLLLKQDEDFLLASHGPFWYRGLAVPYRNYYKKMTEREVNLALKHF